MEDNPNLSVKEQEFKHGAASGVAVEDRSDLPQNFKHGTDDGSPRVGAESKPTPDTKMPCGHKMNGRNLIVCIDGTANQFGAKNTNVIELYNLIKKKVPDNQRTWYNSGIGTYARPSWKSLKFYKQVLYHKIDLAIAWDFERTVLGAYRWLSDNYEEGDCIFLFGFSRGAFQVRVLSAMIEKVGLIYKGNEMQIPFAYELYADTSDDPTVTKIGSQQESGVKREIKISMAERLKRMFWPKDVGELPQENGLPQESKISMAERFKRAFSHEDVKVHFVGAWDTVSSIGVARAPKMLPGTTDGMTHVCYFRHALALDERRVKFLPEYAYGGATKPPAEPKDKNGTPPTQNENQDVTTVTDDRKESMGRHLRTIEVWFAGTHSDIGGGNVENVKMDRSRPPLRWMVLEAERFGLRTAGFERTLSSKELIEIKESLAGVWWLLEVFPLKRLTFTRQESRKQTTHKPHLGSSRKIHPGQKIHSSLFLADQSGTKVKYTPKARPPPDHEGVNEKSFWQGFSGEKASKWLEIDFFEFTQQALESFIAENSDTASQTLRQIATSGDGRQALYENVIEGLRKKRDSDSIRVKHRLLSLAVVILRKGDPNVKLRRLAEIGPLVSDLGTSKNEDYQQITKEFLEWFTDRELVASHFTVDVEDVEGGNVMSVQDYQVHNFTKIEYNVYLLPEAQGPGDLMDREKWKALTKRVEKLVTGSSGCDDDASEEEEPSYELELPVDTRRLILYTGIDIAKKKLKTTVEIVFTLTPVGLAPGVQPWVNVVWRVLRFQPSLPIRHELTWHDEVGFCDVFQENDNTLRPGYLYAVVKPKHMAVLRDNEDNPDFSAQFKMTLETADMAIVNKLPSTQRLALCSIDRARPETDRFSPIIDIGSVKPNDIVLCGPPVMLQAYAIRGYTERLPIDTTKISGALFVDSVGKPRPIDIRTLRPYTAFRLYSNSSGKIILEKD